MIHTKQIFTLIFWVATLWLLVACDSQEGVVTVVAERPFSTPTLLPTHTPSPLPTATPSHTPTITPSHTPTHTPTAIPTTTPFPTVTAPPTIETKTVFLQFGSMGGDGGSDTDLYYGRGMPELVIYTDGQVLLQEGDWRNLYYLETFISSIEMCGLLEQLQDLGFFEVYDPQYAFDETTQYSDGAPEVAVQVHGALSQSLFAYAPYIPYLVSPLKQSYDLIHNYRPFSNTYYIPERIVLWVETSEALPENTLPWPDTLPNILDLWKGPLNSEVVVEGEFVASIMQLFNYRITSQWFMDEGQAYQIILRPLLPNETPYPQLQYYLSQYGLQSFNLPFDCPNLDLPLVAPTLTSSPLFIPTIEPITGLTGNGRILFTSQRDGNEEIYMMNADGANPIRLTNHLSEDKDATWSPDEQHIAFVSNRDGNEEIYVMNANGTDVTRLTYSASKEQNPVWLPDGERIAYISDRTSSSDNQTWVIYLINLDGSNETRFLPDTYRNFSPHWSSDGQKVLFSIGNYIYLANGDGSSDVFLSQGSFPRWSPNEQQIAFLLDYKIHLMDTEGNNITQLNGRRLYSAPFWSPDGVYIAFSRNSNSQLDIYAINVIERRETQLTFTPGDDIITDWRP